MSGDGDAIVFAERVLALLDSGSFTMSYKYAVLLALIDCSLEQLSATGEPPSELRARDISDKVLVLYWRQAVPYSGSDEPRVLRQRPERGKLDLVARIAEFRASVGFDRTLQQAADDSPRAFAELRDRIHITIVRMPLPKLQRMNRGDPFGDGFLYWISWANEVSPAQVHRPDFDDRIHLKSGVGEHLLRIAGIIRPIAQRQWAEFVARRNTDVLDDLTLDEFLFGAERVNLDRVRVPLRRLQDGRCFYCQQELRGRTEVDHFLPWSRSNDNGLDNLVATHSRCNNAKRASLAADVHLQRWLARGRVLDRQLTAMAHERSWPRQPERTHAVARALYLYQAPGTALWVAPDQYTDADVAVLRRMLVTPAATLAADAELPYHR